MRGVNAATTGPLSDEEIGELHERVNEARVANSLLSEAEASRDAQIRKIAKAVADTIDSGTLEPMWAVQKWLEVHAQHQMVSGLKKRKRVGDAAIERLTGHGVKIEL